MRIRIHVLIFCTLATLSYKNIYTAVAPKKTHPDAQNWMGPDQKAKQVIRETFNLGSDIFGQCNNIKIDIEYKAGTHLPQPLRHRILRDGSPYSLQYYHQYYVYNHSKARLNMTITMGNETLHVKEGEIIPPHIIKGFLNQIPDAARHDDSSEDIEPITSIESDIKKPCCIQ